MERIPAPEIDSREFQDILREVRALVPFYTPEWTAGGETDPDRDCLLVLAKTDGE